MPGVAKIALISQRNHISKHFKVTYKVAFILMQGPIILQMIPDLGLSLCTNCALEGKRVAVGDNTCHKSSFIETTTNFKQFVRCGCSCLYDYDESFPSNMARGGIQRIK